MLKNIKNYIKKPVVKFIIGIIGVFIFLLCFEKLKGEEKVVEVMEEIPKVNITDVKKEDIVLYYKTVGRINDHSIHVGYDRIQGKIKQVFVQKGDYIKAGEPLFSIDLTSDLSQLKLEAANLEQSINQLSLVIGQLKNKKDELTRLNHAGLATQNDVNEIARELEQYQEQKKGVNSQKAAISNTIATLEKTGQILSPETGYVREVSFISGEVIGQEDYIKIEKDKKSACMIHVSEEVVNRIKIDDKVVVKVSNQEKEIEGVVKKIHQITSEEILFPVEIELNCEGAILSGRSVNVRIPIYEHKRVLLVPRKAVICFNRQTFLYTVGEDGNAIKKIVKKGKTINEMTEILDGIGAEDKIVTKGQFSVSDGQKVDIVN